MGDKQSDKSDKSFWTTLPGILTGCAAIITAIVGCIAVIIGGGGIAQLYTQIFRPTVTPGPAVVVVASTETFTPSPTFTLILTATPTDVPMLTPNTPVPPTNEPTPVPPTPTPVPPTATPRPPTSTFTPTATPMHPTDTPVPPTKTLTFTPTPSLLEHFDGNTELQGTVDADILVVKNGQLYSPPVVNEGSEWDKQAFRARVNNIRLSVIEFRAAILDGTNGGLGINTSCGDSGDTLIFQFNASTKEFEGIFGEEELVWNQPLEFGQAYTVRLVLDGNVVRAFVDDVEMPEPYPCASMGEWFNLMVGRASGGYIEGYFDYVTLWASSP